MLLPPSQNFPKRSNLLRNSMACSVDGRRSQRPSHSLGPTPVRTPRAPGRGEVGEVAREEKETQVAEDTERPGNLREDATELCGSPRALSHSIAAASGLEDLWSPVLGAAPGGLSGTRPGHCSRRRKRTADPDWTVATAAPRGAPYLLILSAKARRSALGSVAMSLPRLGDF